MAQIFVSYASQDRPKVQTLASCLEAEGWSVWWDRKIPAGKTFDKVISQELAKAQCVLVLWSNKSVESDWVKEEATEAARRNVLVPVQIDDAPIPLGFRRIQAASLSRWNGQSSDMNFRALRESVALLLDESDEAQHFEQTFQHQAEPVAESPPVTNVASFDERSWSHRNAEMISIAILLVSLPIGFVLGHQTNMLTRNDPLSYAVSGAVWAMGLWLALFSRSRLERKTQSHYKSGFNRHSGIIAVVVVMLALPIGYEFGREVYRATNSDWKSYLSMGAAWASGLGLAWYTRRRLRGK